MNKQEKQLLIKHWEFYHELDSGKKTPTTRAQEHFVSVCRGLAQPLTAHERAYLESKSASSLIGDRIAKPCPKKSIDELDNTPRIKMHDSWFGADRKKGSIAKRGTR